MKKRSVTIDGHRTSLLLEPIFWTHLERIAKQQGLSLSALIKAIDETRTLSYTQGTQTEPMANLASSIRVFVVTQLERDANLVP